MLRFTIEHLSPDRLFEAWPVACMSRSHANADWWICAAAALIERGGGILAVRGPDGTIHGVATYEVARRAHVGRVLAVDMLTTFELSRRAPARQAICEALELLGHAFDCRRVILPLPSRGRVQHGAKIHHGYPDFGPADDA